jgi:hypothetical protein
MASTARAVAPRPAATRLAWALCVLAVALALAGLALAAVNGESPAELVTDHHAIGILTTLVVAPIGALIAVGDRRHLLAWLFLVEGRPGAGAVSVVGLVLRFRRAGAVQRQQIKWFAYGAAPSIPLGMFASARPLGPYLELLGAAAQLAGSASASSGSGCGTSTG